MTDTTQKAEAAAEVQSTEAQGQTDAQQTTAEGQEEAFDKERAMSTIIKLREIETQYRKEKREFERIKAEEEKRKLAEMTDVERYKAEAEKLQKELQAERSNLIRLKVANKYQLPEILASRLQGETEDELEADAKTLIESLPKPKTPKLSANDVTNGENKETEAQKRARIYNKGSDIFDVGKIKEGGGGVFFIDKNT